jgi:hypothetical protein
MTDIQWNCPARPGYSHRYRAVYDPGANRVRLYCIHCGTFKP